MTKCAKECQKTNSPCPEKACRHHIDYVGDLNCSLIAAWEHGPMTLDEVAKRMGLSLVRIKQIEEAALVKLSKRVDKELRYD